MTTNQSSWLKEHSLATYFFVTYLISWTIWSPIVAWALYVARRYGQANAAPVPKQVA